VAEQAPRRRRPGIPNPGPTALVGAVFFLGHLEHGLRALRGAPPAGPFSLLYYIGTAWVIATWLRADRRRLGLRSTFDEGFFIFAAWPLALPYYLFASRGWRGALTLLGFIALYLLSYALTLPIILGLRHWLGELR
jgi:hypothetical protein